MLTVGNLSVTIGDVTKKYWRLVFILPIVFTLLCVGLFGVNVPFNEQWEFSKPLIGMLANHDNIWPELWKLHNEHRLVFPKFIMLVLAWLTEWDIRAELVTNLLLAGLSLYVLVRKAKATLTISSPNYLRSSSSGVFVILSVLVFSMAQSENWMWGWQLCIFLNVLFVIIGVDRLTRDNHLTVLNWLLAILCGVVATYSFANGLLYWVVGLAGLLMRSSERRVNKWLVVGWLGASLVVGGPYLTNYHPVSEHPSTQYVFSHPGEAIQYSLAYLGNSVSQFRQLIPVGILVGFVGFTVVLWLNFNLVRQKQLLNSSLLFWHLLLLYALMSDGITVIGRTGFGIEQAFSSRYATISNLFWFWILIISCWQYQRGLLKLSLLFGCITGFFVIMFIGSTVKNTYKFKQRHDDLLAVAAELKRNVYNPALLVEAHPRPRIITLYNGQLRKNHLTFYKDGEK